ncbi:MAG: hypothetical protein EOO59_14235 [Hymenobacter sp.]|nr:MAG: hypothetical protein EOO59_14235 [Hymenobacter sp.]
MKQLLITGLAGGLLLAGCREADEVACDLPAVTTYSGLAGFSQRNSVPVQTFTLTLGQAQTLTTSGGARLTFPANSYRLPGGAVATGTAQVAVREIYSVPDMVLANVPTTLSARGQMLVSGGEFYIRTTQNGVRLQLPPTATVALQSPVPAGQDTTRQLVFNRPFTSPADTLGWRYTNAAPVQLLPPASYLAALPLDSLSWWNIDQFWHAYAQNPNIPVTVETPLATETRVYLRPVGFNGLARLYNLSTASTSATWQSNMPAGAPMIAVVVQGTGTQLYYGAERFTTQAGQVIRPTVTAMSEADIVRLIRQL